MNRTEMEKKIEQALNAEKPDEKVLDRARSILVQKQRRNRKTAWRVYVAAAVSACFLLFGVVAAVLSRVSYENNMSISQAHIEPTGPTWLILAIVAISLGVLAGGVAVLLKLKKK